MSVSWQTTGLKTDVLATVPIWVGAMRQFLQGRKEFRLGRWHPDVHVDFGWQRSRGGRWDSGFVGVRLHLGRYLRSRGFHEYPRFQGHSVIGSMHHTPRILDMLAVTAHEVAHAIQYGPVKHDYLSRKELRVPHGTGFRYIYRLLRAEFVNPLVLGGTIGDNQAVPWHDVAHALPFRTKYSPEVTKHGTIAHITLDGDVTVSVGPRRNRRQGDRLCTRVPGFKLREPNVEEMRPCPICWELATNYLVRSALANRALLGVGASTRSS